MGHPAGRWRTADTLQAVPDDVALLREVELAWVRWCGPVVGRGSVSFVGTPTIEVLRCGPGPDGLIRYATLGMCRTPMGADRLVDPTAAPRAELVLALGSAVDSVLRSLAAIASAPAVDGLVLAPDGTVDLQQPLWDGSPFTAVLVQPSVAEVARSAGPPVQLFPVVPLSATELAYRRIHGAAALRDAWDQAGTDLTGLSRS